MSRASWWTTPALRHATLIACVAAIVRALVLWQAASGPFFTEPLVDARTYHDLARGLAEHGTYQETFLWQAPLYPLALAGLYTVGGVSVTAARLAGALLGVVTVLLAWVLARRWLGPRAALAVGLILALHGVLIFFETALLATGLATFWVVALTLLADGPTPGPRRALLLGASGALALLTRPVLLPVALVALLWAGRRQRWRVLSVALTGAAAVLIPFATLTHHHTGHTGLWPPSGGVNLYLGNHPDFPHTLTIRPGLPWEQLIATPAATTGVDDPWRNRHWFTGQAWRYLREQPAAWLDDLGEKALMLVSSRELPRNVDLAAHRPWSSVFAALCWQAGPLGFPGGVLLPLAAVGLVAARRRLPPLLPLMLGSYAVMLLLVFPAARYRAPLWPLLTIAAVAGALALGRWLWRGRPRRRLAAAAALLVLVLLVTAPGPFATERMDLEAEMWHGVGFNQLAREEPAAAAASFRRALAARQDYPEAWNRLGVALARQDSFTAAIGCFERAAALAPGYPDPRRNLPRARAGAARQRFAAARAHERAGRDAAAAAVYREVLALTPDWAEAQARLAWLLATTDRDTLRDGREARRLAEAALASHGEDHPWLQEVLAAARAQARADSLAGREGAAPPSGR